MSLKKIEGAPKIDSQILKMQLMISSQFWFCRSCCRELIQTNHDHLNVVLILYEFFLGQLLQLYETQ